MKAKLTFLGTGTSSGVPMLGCNCPVCRSCDPRDKRYRSSVFVEYGGLGILVDCGPDFRSQALRSGITHIDAILLTHNHTDHIGGLDDTRALNATDGHPMQIYCEKYVEDTLRRMFPYAFEKEKYPGAPEWQIHRISGESPFEAGPIDNTESIRWEMGYGYRRFPPVAETCRNKVEIIPIQGWHLKKKEISVLGYRFGNIAYLTDMNLIEESEFEKLHGLDAVTLNCVKPGKHNSHFSLPECLDFFEKVGAKESYITHISHILPPHAGFEKEFPPHIHPAYDTLTII